MSPLLEVQPPRFNQNEYYRFRTGFRMPAMAIREINGAGTSALLVEQNERKALEIVSYGYVMESGQIELEGSASELLSSPRVVEAYLGVS